MKYNLSKIMRHAWRTFNKLAGKISFGVALHRAWLSAKSEPVNAARIAAAKAAAGITETVNTFAGWRDAGYKVQHGARALFAVDLVQHSKGDFGTYRASFFGASQVAAV